MYVIGISGVSGSGKTTVGEILERTLPNAKRIDGDVYQYESFNVYRSDAERLFGNAFLKPDNSFSFTCVIAGGEKGYEYLDIICPYINRSIFYEKEIAATEGCDFFIVEWQALTILEFINTCDKQIVMVSDFAKRSDMLSKRIVHGCTPEFAKKRADFFAFAFEHLNPKTVRVFNDYDILNINKSLKIIVNDIYMEISRSEKNVE